MEIIEWNSTFKKAVNRNSQLSDSKLLSLSLIKDEIPFIELIEIKVINDKSICCAIDKRTTLYKVLKENEFSSLLIHYSLTRQTFKFLCLNSVCLPIEKLKNNLHKEKLEKLLENPNFTNFSEKFDEAFKIFIKEQLNVLDSVNELRKSLWNSLSNEDKLKYESIEPETLKSQEKKRDDLTLYLAQEEVQPSDNFELIFFYPIEIEETNYPMPQVVANSRKPDFESLYKPKKEIRKYLHLYNFIEENWIIKEINP